MIILALCLGTLKQESERIKWVLSTALSNEEISVKNAQILG